MAAVRHGGSASPAGARGRAREKARFDPDSRRLRGPCSCSPHRLSRAARSSGPRSAPTPAFLAAAPARSSDAQPSSRPAARTAPAGPWRLASKRAPRATRSATSDASALRHLLETRSPTSRAVALRPAPPSVTSGAEASRGRAPTRASTLAGRACARAAARRAPLAAATRPVSACRFAVPAASR